MRLSISVTILSVAFVCLSVASAEENPSKLSLGLSYLATSGNSSSQTGGLDVLFKQDFHPWGIEVTANYLRAEQNGSVTAKRLFGGVKGIRRLDQDFDGFLAVSALQDRFAGLDPRLLAVGGVNYRFLKGPEHELAFEAGVTWTRDSLLGNGTKSYTGALAAANYAWNLSKTSKLTENLSLFPSFKQGSDWRVESQTGLQASVTGTVALKVSYSFRYANRPVPGFGGTDTVTAASVVISFL